MLFKTIQSHLEGIRFITPEQGKILYDFILEKKPLECLELGFAYGTSSCYIAAALDELGQGHLTTVDLLAAQSWAKNPSIEDLLAKTGLQKYVTVIRENTSYTWFLKKKIEERSHSSLCEPIYDFCFIDGSKNWTIDGCAFFLVDKLLKPNGWLIFDDYKWTYGDADNKRDETDGITHRKLGKDEVENPHIELIFRLLVMQHPDYSEFKIENESWAYAHKVKNSAKVLRIETKFNFQQKLFNSLAKMKKVIQK